MQLSYLPFPSRLALLLKADAVKGRGFSRRNGSLRACQQMPEGVVDLVAKFQPAVSEIARQVLAVIATAF